jgi:hypothetical protein
MTRSSKIARSFSYIDLGMININHSKNVVCFWSCGRRLVHVISTFFAEACIAGGQGSKHCRTRLGTFKLSTCLIRLNQAKFFSRKVRFSLVLTNMTQTAIIIPTIKNFWKIDRPSPALWVPGGPSNRGGEAGCFGGDFWVTSRLSPSIAASAKPVRPSL